MENKEKQVIIAGVPRSGKSTVCYELSQKGNYQHLEVDTLTFAFENSFPQIGITHTDSWDFLKTTKPLGKFMSEWLKEIQKSDNCRKIGYKMVLDIYHIIPEDFVKYFSREDCEIYFLGYPNISIEEKFDQIRYFDTPYDWTSKEKDSILKEKIKTYIEISKWLKEECEKYELPFIDISENREKVLNELLESILEKEI